MRLHTFALAAAESVVVQQVAQVAQVLWLLQAARLVRRAATVRACGLGHQLLWLLGLGKRIAVKAQT
jgi:hypothetical protein